MARPPARSGLFSYGASSLLVLATTAVSLLVRAVYAVPDLEVLYFLAIMFAAVRYGRRPSILAAFLSVALYDFFFVPPHLTFAVADLRYLLTFALMFGVGWLLSELTARVRRQEHEARVREERTNVLYALTRELAAATNPTQVAEAVAQNAARVFGATTIVRRHTEDGSMEVAASVGHAPHESTRMSVPIRLGDVALAELVLVPEPAAAVDRDFIETYARQAALALDRVRLIDEARVIAVRAKAEEMRSALLSTVSHDLRTPLAAITGAATSLRDNTLLDPSSRAELLDTVIEEADRLEHLVANLLEMTRLAGGNVALRRAWMPLDEMVSSALTRLESKIGSRDARVALDDVPLVSVDPVLFEQVLVNLLENATKYTPPGTPLEVSSSVVHGEMIVEVIDRGVGLTPGTERQIFDRFQRGAHPGVGGAGLGLAICKAIVEAHGGTIAAENHRAGGACFRIRLPLQGEPPALDSVS
jgi:two-component system, OmpR family, sensor histidine kinase KdpD